jgi:hypothetical protein
MRTVERWRWSTTKSSGACSNGGWHNSVALPVLVGNDEPERS